MAHKFNQGAIALAVAPQIRPRTNQILIKYHQFRIFFAKCDMYTNNVDTKEHIVDIFKKPLDTELLGYLCYKLNVW